MTPTGLRNRRATFAAATGFHYLGSPRVAVVWEEALIPALPASLELNDLRALPAALRGRPTPDIRAFEALLPDKADRISGGAITVPVSTAKLARDISMDAKAKLVDRHRHALEALGKLPGGKVYLKGDEDTGWTLIGRGVSLPSDLPPVFVLDASARLTRNYDQLDRYGFDVVHMEPALVSYANLNIEWWGKGCGKTALASPNDRATIVNAIAKLINSKPDEAWLIVHSKVFGGDCEHGKVVLPDDLTCLLKNPENVRSITWGLHLGTNDFRDVANVVVMGSYGYTSAAYEALHLAISGQSNGVVAGRQRKDREDAEFMQNLYQAVCRSRIRRQVSGTCLPATAYLIMTHSDHREALVSGAFPDCSIHTWQPVEPKKTPKFQLIITEMKRMLEGRTMLRKLDLIEACRSTDPSYLDKVFRSPKFKRYAAANGITVKKGIIYRTRSISLAA